MILNNIKIITKTKGYYFSLFINFIILNLLTFYMCVGKDISYISNVYEFHLFLNMDLLLVNNLFLYLLPLTIGIVFCDYATYHHKAIDYIGTRVNRKRFLYSNVIASFIVAFIITAVMVGGSIIISYCCYNMDSTLFYKNMYSFSLDVGPSLEYFIDYMIINNPIAYILLSLVLFSFFGGLLGVLSYSLVLLTNKGFLSCLYLFIFCILTMLVFRFIPNGLAAWDIYNSFIPNHTVATVNDIFKIEYARLFWTLFTVFISIVAVEKELRKYE